MEQQHPKPRGRRPLPESERLSERMEVRLTPAAYSKALALGGPDWVRAAIKRAKLPKDKPE